MKELKLSEFEGIDEGRLMDAEKKQFAQVPFYVICDERISSTAKWVLSYAIMRSGIQKWEIRKKDILTHTKEKRFKIDSAFDELIEYGYLNQSELFTNKEGKFQRKYKFYKDPVNNPFYEGKLPQNEYYDKIIAKKRLSSHESENNQKVETQETYNQIIPKKIENKKNNQNNSSGTISAMRKKISK